MRVRPKEHASMSSSSQVVPSTPDVLVRNEGTVFLFCPLTSRGKQWIEEHVQPDAQWFGSALVVDSLGERVLAAMRPMDVQTTYQKMIERGLSARTVRYTHAVLKSA